MIPIKRSVLKFYLKISLYVLVLLGFLTGLVVVSIQQAPISNKVFLILLFSFCSALIIYYLVAFIKRVPRVRFDDDGIYLNHQFLAWHLIQNIRFNISDYVLQNFNITTVFTTTDNAGYKIINKYYRNYQLLSQFMFEKYNDKVIQDQRLEDDIMINKAPDKTYFGYNLLSPFAFYPISALVLVSMVIKSNTDNTNFWFLIAFLLWGAIIFVFFIIGCIAIQISNNKLTIRYWATLFYKQEYELSKIKAIRFDIVGRGIKRCSIVLDDYTVHTFIIDLFFNKSLKRIREHFNANGIVVIDKITIK